MTTRVKVAIAGIGNNVSALVQGVYYYRALKTRQPDASPPGIRRPVIDGLGVDDVEFVAGFDVAESKVGKDISTAIFARPNDYPRLDVEVPAQGAVVEPGITKGGETDNQIARTARSLAERGAEVAPARPTKPLWHVGCAQIAPAALGGEGLDAVSSYQFNLGGNHDFQNLSEAGTEKRQSKLNALSADESTLNRVHMMPFGYVPQMGDQKTRT